MWEKPLPRLKACQRNWGNFISFALIIAADALLLSDSGSSLGYAFLAAAIASIPLLHVLFAYTARKGFESNRSASNQETCFSFFEEHFEAYRKNYFARLRYDELKSIIEGKDSFYLIVLAAQGYIVPKTDAEEISFLRERMTRRSSPSLLGRYILALIASAMLSFTFWSIAIHEVPEGDVLRSWVQNALDLFILLMLAAIVLECIMLNLERIGRIKKKRRRIAARIASVAAALAGSFLLLFVLVLAVWDIGTVTENGNGTYTYTYTPWLDKTRWTLYADGGPLYLRYLRPMTGPDDTDPAITKEEWLAAREQELQSLAGEADGSDAATTEESTDAGEESAGSMSQEASVMRGTLQQVQNGYEGLYQAYFTPQGDSFEVSYTAKGEAYVTLSDDGDAVRYLMYDRDSANGNCGLYVLYEVQKEEGNYSFADAEILDMYAYKYATGATADSGRTSWSDTGSQEYLDLTRE